MSNRVTGFPSGSDSMWSAEEQQELADFLAALRDTKAKMLLTSRRDETGLARQSAGTNPRPAHAHTRRGGNWPRRSSFAGGATCACFGVLDPLLFSARAIL